MVERVSPPLSSTRIRMTLNSKADTVLISMAFKGQAIDMGVSQNRGTPKWMVYNGKNPIKMDPFGGNPLFSETSICVTLGRAWNRFHQGDDSARLESPTFGSGTTCSLEMCRVVARTHQRNIFTTEAIKTRNMVSKKMVPQQFC